MFRLDELAEEMQGETDEDFASPPVAGTGALAYGTGHDDPTVSDVAIMLALIPLWLYAAVLVSQYPTAQKLKPLLAGLQPTDQSITSADPS